MPRLLPGVVTVYPVTTAAPQRCGYDAAGDISKELDDQALAGAAPRAMKKREGVAQHPQKPIWVATVLTHAAPFGSGRLTLTEQRGQTEEETFVAVGHPPLAAKAITASNVAAARENS